MTNECEAAINTIKLMHFTTEPTIFYESSFSSSKVFAEVMFACGKLFKDSDNIVVRYAKTIDKETKEVKVNFQILKSKAKVFRRYVVDNNESFTFSVKSPKEVKECIKYLNSLGVKAEDGENLVESGYDAIISRQLQIVGKIKVHVHKHENYVLLEWENANDDEEFLEYKDCKEQIEKILSI